jgi:hypothetical protein
LSAVEDVNDGHEIFGKFLLSGFVCLVIQNDDSASVELNDVLYELETEAGKSVLVGHHKVSEISLHREFQNGL